MHDLQFRAREEWDASMPPDKGVSDCAFCTKDNLKNIGGILRQNTYWYIVYNLHPCGGPSRGKKHLLLIPHEHLQYTHELIHEHWIAIQEAEQWIFNYFAGQDFFSFIKHTDPIKSIQHIHYHYIAGGLDFNDVQNSVLAYDKEHTN